MCLLFLVVVVVDADRGVDATRFWRESAGAIGGKNGRHVPPSGGLLMRDYNLATCSSEPTHLRPLLTLKCSRHERRRQV
jgi:hypothetical protein